MLQYKKRDVLPSLPAFKMAQAVAARETAGWGKQSAMRPYKTHMKNDTEDGEVWRAR